MNSAAKLLFVGTAILAALVILIVRSFQIESDMAIEAGGKKKKAIISVLSVLGFFLMFVPLVIWQLMEFPKAAGLPAVLVLLATLLAHSKSPIGIKSKVLALAIVSTSMWLIYGFYEYEMLKWEKTVVAPIRVDLLILAPLLYLSSLSMYRFLSWANKHNHDADA